MYKYQKDISCKENKTFNAYLLNNRIKTVEKV